MSEKEMFMPSKQEASKDYFGELKEGKIEFGVAIYPPTEVRRIAQGIVARIEALGAKLDNKLDDEHLPHMTIFQGGFPVDPSTDLENATVGLDSETLNIVMKENLSLSAVGNVFWDAEISGELLRLHNTAIEKFRPITQGCLMKQWVDRLKNSTGLDETGKKLVLENGFAASGKSFLPHITLGKLVDRSDWEKIRNIQIPASSFRADNIIGGPLGYHGNIEKIEFDIKK